MTEKSKRGFASMSPDRRREIARMGGASVPPSKRSFSQNRDLASAAGKFGGCSVPPEKRSFSKDADLAARAGKSGGISKSRHRSGVVEAEGDGHLASTSEPTAPSEHAETARRARTDGSRAG